MAEAIKKSVIGLRNQINAVCAVSSMLQKEVEAIKLRSGKVYFDIFDNENMDDNNDDNNDVKKFSVYNNTFDAIIKLWKVQFSNIKSNSDQTAKWLSSLVKSSHELVCIMGIQAELWRKAGPNTKSKLRTLLNVYIEAANMFEEWKIAQVILIPKPKNWDDNIDITRPITLIESTFFFVKV
ncbi:hypothetical protein G9A89_022543 [Geosiphon pyriformis]|nr:hypothetical protein G9A89_022543 [Geosiphon pyriformis]